MQATESGLIPLFGEGFEVLRKADAELLAAAAQIDAPPPPAGVAFALLGVDVGDGDQDGGLLDSAEIGVAHRIENPHGGREVHVGVDKRRNVLVELADFLDQDAIILLVIASGEEGFVVGIVQVEAERIAGRDQPVAVGEILPQEPCLLYTSDAADD